MSQEHVPLRTWWQDGLFSPSRTDFAEPSSPDDPTGSFVHEKWWLEDAAKCAAPAK
jgi:hypothetical protein